MPVLQQRGACFGRLSVRQLRDVHLHHLQFSRRDLLPKVQRGERRFSVPAQSLSTCWLYTERYMGLLSDNLKGYIESAPVEQAAKMRGNLLLIHSMLDDNVHPQNTMQLLTALTNAGRDAELRIYPPGRHGAAYNAQSARLIRRVTDEYLRRHLKGASPPALAPELTPATPR